MKGFSWLLNRVRLIWVSLVSKIKSFFSSNKHKSSNVPPNGVNDENKQGTQDNTLAEQKLDKEEYFDAVEDLNEQEAEASSGRKKIYESNKFYSARNLQEVQEFIDHSNTFAVAIFEHSIDKLPGCCNDGNYQLTSLQLNDEKESRACTLSFKQSNIKISSDHIQLYMSFYFESKKQETINHLFQRKSKNNDTLTPSIIILLEKPSSINLNPSFRWTELVNRSVWNKIKENETKKSSTIPKALFPTFTIELLEGQNLSLSINKDAIPESIENLKDEKPTIKKILEIPGVSSLIKNVINDIVDKVINGKERTNFHIRDVLMNGETINELQNSIQKVEEKVNHDPDFKVVNVKNAVGTRGWESRFST